MSTLDTLTGVIVLAVVLAATVLLGLWWRRRSGRVREVAVERLLTARELGADLGARATLVQFSTAFCQPCRATRVTLADVSELVPGVRHIEIDAESHLDLVRDLHIVRTPTVLIVDAAGRIGFRATGAPRREQVLQALDSIVSDAP
jgi:thiol-disulfide isomerase/thioredoxin